MDRLYRTLGFAVLGWVSMAASLAGQELRLSPPSSANSAADGDASPTAQLSAKREQINAELRVAMRQAQEQQSAEAAAQPDPNVELLKQIESVVAQQQTVQNTLLDLEQQVQQLEQQIKAAQAGQLDLQPPFSLQLYDQIKDELDSLAKQEEIQAAAKASAQEAVDRAKSVADEKQQQLRLLKEQLGDARSPELETAELAARLADETLKLRRDELRVEELNAQVRSLRQTLAKLRLDALAGRVTFDRDDLSGVLAEIDKREDDLRRQLALLESELSYAEQSWMAAKARLDAQANPPRSLVEEVNAKKAKQQLIQLQIGLINQQIQRLAPLRVTWQRRYALLNESVSRQDRIAWREETAELIEQLQREQRQRQLKVDEVRSAIVAVDRQLESLGSDESDTRRWLQQRRSTLNSQIELLNDSILSIVTYERVHQKLLDELTADSGPRLREMAELAWYYTKRIWNTELYNVDDNPITVGKIVTGLLLLLFGYLASWWLSSALGNRLPRFGVAEAAAHAIQSLAFYCFLVAFALMSLKMVNVPLTVFTFLGGAIAIGVGFGSQNILNNFISGLILLAERPIKVGDLIQLDTLYGNVKHIGARSTRIRTGDNLEIIVPNSKFLENNVINLTRGDDRLRTRIVVGIAYGSPVRKALELLEQAAEQHSAVHERPKPFCIFADFGDNALIIELLFWITARTETQRRRVESEIRLSVDDLFREHGITIAFPQRDLHLDTLKPLELRILGDGEGG
ncbi:MAG: mechanosensitive ion channel protein MscS, partial [Planctomycetota bacterium]